MSRPSHEISSCSPSTECSTPRMSTLDHYFLKHTMSKTSTLAKSNSTSSLCTSDKCNVDEPLSCIVKTGSNGSILSSPSNEMFHKNNSFDKNNCSNILDGNDSITTQTDRSSGNSTSQLGYNENWGWFDDEQISDSSDVLTPLPSEENEAKGKRKEKDRTKIKKGGLLEFAHSELKPLDTVHKGSESSAMAVTAPTYVLEESRSSQNLWRETAGNRPPQPVEDRAYFEFAWAQNFSKSLVKYDMPLEILTASSPISLSPFADNMFCDHGVEDGSNYHLAAPFNNPGRIGGPSRKDGSNNSQDWVKEAEANAAEATLRHGILRSAGAGKLNYTSMKSMEPHKHQHTFVNKKVKGSGADITVLVRGDNVFGTTVSKSFTKMKDKAVKWGNDSVSVSVASYRVVQGSFRDTVGVWKRFKDFNDLSRKISKSHDECSINPIAFSRESSCCEEDLPNALASWRLLKKRQRWYRCLDAGYLSLKVFLLERFLHDVLFESIDPRLLRDFVGVDDVVQ